MGSLGVPPQIRRRRTNQDNRRWYPSLPNRATLAYRLRGWLDLCDSPSGYVAGRIAYSSDGRTYLSCLVVHEPIAGVITMASSGRGAYPLWSPRRRPQLVEPSIFAPAQSRVLADHVIGPIPTLRAEPCRGAVLLRLTWPQVRTAHLIRLEPDGTQTTVSATEGVMVCGTWVGLDHEVPLDQACVWRATSPESQEVLTTPEAIGVPSGGRAWLRHLSRPGLSRPIRVAIRPTQRRAARRGIYYLAGRPDPMVVTDLRAGDEGSMGIYVESDIESVAIRALLADGSVLLLSCPAAWTGPRQLYISPGDVDLTPAARVVTEAGEYMTLPYVVVQRPDLPAVSTPGATWADVSRLGSWDELAGRPWDDLLVPGW